VVLSLPQSYIVKPFATILKDLPQPCWHWLTGGTFDSATGGTFQSDTDGTFNSDIPGTFESDMGGTFKVLQSFEIDIASFSPKSFYGYVALKDNLDVNSIYPTSLSTISQDTKAALAELKEGR
jgi:hypothetical protein